MIDSVRDDWRLVVALVSGSHFFAHFYALTLPPLFPLIRSELHLNNAELGLIVSVTMIGSLLQIPVGNLVDRIGGKWVLVGGITLTSGGIALIGLGPTYLAIVALAVVTGLGQAAFHPADYALLNASADSNVQGRAFSIHTSGGYAGSAAAPVVVGTIGFTMGWRIALFAVGAVGLLYAAIVVVALSPVYRRSMESDTPSDEPGEPDESDESDESTGGERSLLFVVKHLGIIAMVSFFVMRAFSNKGIQTFTPTLAIDVFDVSASVGGALLSSFFAVGALGVLVGGVLTDRYPPTRVIAVSLLIAGGLLLFTVSGLVSFGTLVLIGLFGLIGFFASVVSPARDQLVSDLSSDESMGQTFGLVFTGGTIGALTGPFVLGVVADSFSITASFVVIALMYFVAMGIALSIGWRGAPTSMSADPAKGD